MKELMLGNKAVRQDLAAQQDGENSEGGTTE